jgi:hypothetical protein
MFSLGKRIIHNIYPSWQLVEVIQCFSLITMNKLISINGFIVDREREHYIQLMLNMTTVQIVPPAYLSLHGYS